MPFMWALWLCQCAQTSAAVLLAGTAALRLLARGTDLERFSGWHRLARASGCVLLGATGLQLGLTAADMSGLPLSQACSREVLGRVLGGTFFGAVWKVRGCLLIAVLAVLAAQGRLPAAGREGGWKRGSGVLEAVGALLAAGLLATLVWSGHAQASDKRAWLLPMNVLHVIAVGVWPGGLLPLALLLAQARRDSRLHAAAVTVTRRFSLLSVAAVGALTLSGLGNGLGLVGTFPALWSSVYGRLILCKVALLVGMVGLGAVNRRLIRPDAPGDATQTLRRLRRNVAWESVLATLAVLAAEALAMNAHPIEG